MEKPSPVKQHLGYLDGLRAVAALYVVLVHTLLQVHEALPGFVGRISTVFTFGSYAVALFIVLSGFCLMLPVVKSGEIRGGAIHFFRRRAKRILPPYFIALALSGALAWGAWRVTHQAFTWGDVAPNPVTAKSVVSHLLLIHDVVGEDYTINYALWSIAVEWRIYFLFPLIILGWKKFSGGAVMLVIVVTSYLLFFALRKINYHGLTAYYTGLFTMGILAASIAYSPSTEFQRLRELPWNIIFALASAVMIVVSFFSFSSMGLLPEYLRDGFLGLWAMCLLVKVSLEKCSIHQFLSWKPMVFLGTFSYSIYLIHAPLLQILWQYVFAPLKSEPFFMFLALSLFGIPLIIILSYLFFLTCERPFMSKGPSQHSQEKVLVTKT